MIKPVIVHKITEFEFPEVEKFAIDNDWRLQFLEDGISRIHEYLLNISHEDEDMTSLAMGMWQMAKAMRALNDLQFGLRQDHHAGEIIPIADIKARFRDV